ncbi:glycoside hydrolase family 15 protein [Pyxidicoccus fallax]|uniref:Glycoside hydrolase family 15 protein n=1 Tax=Pyxidicoccus fallax TaxID=394095 RepID=A0A848LWF5_9BACT|nr:glycoside hydrolase family 15 protein [Pyxidicoccus fallax]NMO21979.1 glycoside hydrolase family 15 protein [Pyxidicoccus fallax]NPC85641.1 glycoside hydrolase family 15 protein [Pyxidicoccus fallax]
MSGLAISDYALLSDCRSAALVSRMGSVDWLCFPRFDGPSVFARLLDAKAGHFSLRPEGEARASRRYRERTLVLETTFQTPTGTVVVVDALATGSHERGHELGRASPGVLLRRVTCTHGRVTMRLELSARPEYGLVSPSVREVEGGVACRGGATALLLAAAVPLDVEGPDVRATFTLEAGESTGFAVQHHVAWDSPVALWSQEKIARRLEDTMETWRSWAEEHQSYEGPWRELVHHSGRVLQGLIFQPTGAVIAAPTTSLPEALGGKRNWDYRYTWMRDASFVLDALWVAACPDEAERYFQFLAESAQSQLANGAELQAMFGVGGEHDLTERVLNHLSGWRGSAPVRVGNNAWSQRQLDVYGELLCSVHRLEDMLERMDDTFHRFLVDAAEVAAARWREKDRGIWEVRCEPRHFVHSKLMCWVALDRAISLADKLGAESKVEHWTRTREDIRRAVLEEGWNERVGAFTQSFGSEVLDAACLMIPITGFLPATDARVRSTVRAIQEHLMDRNGLLHRYRMDDGIEGDEGAFLLCTFWLAQVQAMAGELEAATVTFTRAASFANDVGLLAEEVDPERREVLGNFPQAFSHVGLVNAAWAIHEASRRSGRPMEVTEVSPSAG